MIGPQRPSPRWGVTPWVVFGSLLFALPLLPQSPLPSWALEQAQTPGQVVQQWLTVYPKDLDTAVTLTTINLRQGWSQKEWVRTKKAPLGYDATEIPRWRNTLGRDYWYPSSRHGERPYLDDCGGADATGAVSIVARKGAVVD